MLTGKALRVDPMVSSKGAQPRMIGWAMRSFPVFTDDVGGVSMGRICKFVGWSLSTGSAQCPSGEQGRTMGREGWFGAPLSTASGCDRLGVKVYVCQ